MDGEKRLFTYVEVDDSTPVQKLKFTDQVRVLLRYLTEDPASELKSEDAYTREYMTLRADLLDLLHKATTPIKAGKHKSVIISVDSKFSYILEETLRLPEISGFFLAEVAYPNIGYDIPRNILVRLTLKEAHQA